MFEAARFSVSGNADFRSKKPSVTSDLHPTPSRYPQGKPSSSVVRNHDPERGNLHTNWMEPELKKNCQTFPRGDYVLLDVRGHIDVFSCGWHITLDGKDVYSPLFRTVVGAFGFLARLARFADLPLNDQVEACRRVFESDTRWTVVRGNDLEEGESQGLPVWSRHVGDPILKSNRTRRVDFALFMVEALKNDELIHEAPAIVGCQTPSSLASRRGQRTR